MRPQTITQTGVGSSAWLPLDPLQNPFSVSFGCVINASPNYTVEHTFDPILTGATPTAFPHASVATATANKDGNYAFPITAIRVTMNSGTGGVTMTVHNPTSY
jgi:hypothetical protein